MPVSKGRKKKVPKIQGQRSRGQAGFNIFRVPGKSINEDYFSFTNQLQLFNEFRNDSSLLYKEIKREINEVTDQINSFDKIYLVGGIASIFFNPLEKKDHGTGAETALEYCLSIALASPNSNAGVIPNWEVIRSVFSALVSIRQKFVAYFGFSTTDSKVSEYEGRLRFEIVLESLFVRGEGYYSHLKKVFLDIFEPHNQVFLSKYGFLPIDIIEACEKFEECMGCKTQYDAIPNIILQQKIDRWLSQKGIEKFHFFTLSGSLLTDFVKDNPEVQLSNDKVISYDLFKISDFEKIFKIDHFLSDKHKKVADALSIAFGENSRFGEGKFGNEVLSPSLIFSKPLVKDGGNYYFFSTFLPARNFFKIAYSLLENADPAYFISSFLGNKSSSCKDVVIEKTVLELFRNIAPQVSFFPNLKYSFEGQSVDLKCAQHSDSIFEVDILGISPKATFIIEVKAGLVSDEARRGAALSLAKDLKTIIGDAVCQCYRASKHIELDENAEFVASNGEIIRPLNRKKVYRISVSFSCFGSSVGSLYKLRELDIIDRKSDFAWAINIYDLISFSKLFSGQYTLMDYLDKRIPLYKNENIHSADEMDMIGFYLERDLKVSKRQSEIELLASHRFKHPIDHYFELGGKKPVKV